MADIKLAVEARANTGKGVARKLRATGKIPGIIYGADKPSISVIADEKICAKLVNDGAFGRLVTLDVDGEQTMVLLKDVQIDPIRGDLLHVDFQAVAMDKEISTVVSVSIIGEDSREDDGGIVASGLREIEVSCLPNNIPDRIVVDISALSLGDNITVADVQAPEGVTIETNPDEVIVSIVAPAEIVEEDDDEEAEEVAEEATEEE